MNKCLYLLSNVCVFMRTFVCFFYVYVGSCFCGYLYSYMQVLFFSSFCLEIFPLLMLQKHHEEKIQELEGKLKTHAEKEHWQHVKKKPYLR